MKRIVLLVSSTFFALCFTNYKEKKYFEEIISEKYLHLSTHYDGLEALYSKTGDHSILGNHGFVNHPVAYQKDENGNITHQRKFYANR
ncbi:hypothetical protein [Flavobacterium sp. FlaQc-47]|uniref:hypothetical protein n=1 Tax=Flavobacterium sp. FlaQc-47 TaxID=3374180 RepID=UPI003756A2D0